MKTALHAAVVLVSISAAPAAIAAGHKHSQRAESVLLHGRLLRPDGRPIPNATVVFYPLIPAATLSARRTAADGLFAFPALPGKSYEIHFFAPGFTTRALPVTTKAPSIQELPDVIMADAQASEASSSLRSERALRLATLPSDLLRLIQADLSLSAVRDCLADQGIQLEQAYGLTLFDVSAERRGVVVHGLGSCVAGANNAPILVYSESGGQWQKVLNESGNHVEVRSWPKSGFAELVLWQHASALESHSLTYRFDGRLYRPVRCQTIMQTNPQSSRGPLLKVSPCSWDWRASTPG